MTPELRQVIADRLAEFAPDLDESTRARMVRAMDPTIELALVATYDWLFARRTALDIVGDLADEQAIANATVEIETRTLAGLDFAARLVLPGVGLPSILTELHQQQVRDLIDCNRFANEQMQNAQAEHAGERHNDHCWARLAWGDGECECAGSPGTGRKWPSLTSIEEDP